MAHEIDLHFSRAGLSGATLVVVAIGTDVYGATGEEPIAALRAAAARAADDRARRGDPVDAETIIEQGLGRMGSAG